MEKPMRITDPGAKGFFSPSYTASRDNFRQQAHKIVTQETGRAEVGFIEVESKIDSHLTVDWLYIGAKKEPKNVVVITSGIHGSEGYAGRSVFGSIMNKEYERLKNSFIRVDFPRPEFGVPLTLTTFKVV